MSARLPALLATGAVLLASATGLGLVTAPSAHAASGQVTAQDDSGITSPQTPVTVDLLANDSSTGGPLDPASVTFDPFQAYQGMVVSNNGRTLVIAHQGEFDMNGDGTVTFTPAAGFTGYSNPAYYMVNDQSGNTAEATVSITVHVAPVGHDDAVTVAAGNQTTSLNVLANDVHDPYTDLEASSLHFPDGQSDVTVDGTGLTATTSSGTYSIDTKTGRVGFVPNATVSGVAVPVQYQASDSDGRTFGAYVRPTVLAVPTWTINAASASDGTPQAVDVLTAQLSYSDNRTPDPAQLTFAATQADNPGSTVGNNGRSITLAGGVATATIDAATGLVSVVGARTTEGQLKFDLRVTGTYAQAATGVLAVTMAHGMLANDDTARTSYAKVLTVPVLANDVAGTGSSIDATSVVFPTSGQPNGVSVSGDGKTLVVPGEGGYSIDPSGAITFTAQNGSAMPAFVGTTSPVTYQVADSNGTTATATLTVAVRAPLEAMDDSGLVGYGDWEEPAVNVLANDGGDSSVIDYGSLRFPTDVPQPGTVSDEGTTLTVPGQGTYYANANGGIAFHPDRGSDYFHGFYGTATPVTYAVNSDDGTLTAKLTMQVEQPPIANPDSATTRSGRAVTVDVLANDTVDPHGQLITPVGFAEDQPMAGATADGNNLVIPSVGTFAPSGTDITFTPVPGYQGTAVAAYQLSDTLDNAGIGTFTVHVLKPMSAVDDAVTTPFGTSPTIPVLTNDSTDASLSIVSSSLRFVGGPGATLSADRHTVTTAQGSYRVVGSTVVFAPTTGFTGATSPVAYQVDDSGGDTGSATVTVTVHRRVIAADDAATTVPGIPVSIQVLGNDTADAAAPLRANSVSFAGQSQPTGSTVDSAGRYVVVPHQGTYLADTDGTVDFIPADGFAGLATPVRYSVADGDGTHASANIRVTVTGRITPRADTPSVAWGSATPVNVIANDATLAPLVPSSVVFNALGQPAGAKVVAGGKQLSVPGQATYAINPSTGVVTVTPVKSVSGRVLSSVRYSVRDTSGASSSAGLLTATVKAAPGLAAKADAASTKVGRAITVSVLGNDHASPGSKFSTSSVVLTGATSKAVRTSLTAGGKKLVVAGQGTYVVNAAGTITFTPAAGYAGKATPVGYRAADTNGLTVSSTLSVTVTK